MFSFTTDTQQRLPWEQERIRRESFALGRSRRYVRLRRGLSRQGERCDRHELHLFVRHAAVGRRPADGRHRLPERQIQTHLILFEGDR